MTRAEAKIFDANIAKLKRTSKAGLWLIGKKDAKKVALNQFAHRHKEFQTEKGRESTCTKDLDPCRLSLRPEGHGFRCKTTFVSNAKTKSILGGIHMRFENSRQMNINLAHIHLLPASCPSKIVLFFPHQNQFFVRTLTEGIIIII